MSDEARQVSTQPDLPEVAWAAWWEATHDGMETRYMSRDAELTMGRDRDCEIRIGADPIADERVPRQWARLSWYKGQVLVANMHSRLGLELTGDPSAGVVATVVPPGAAATPPRQAFVIDAKVPADPRKGKDPAEFRVSVMAATQPVEPRRMEAGEHVVETAHVLSLTPTQRTIGAAIIAPLAKGRGHRASYEMLVRSTNYAMRTVREAVAAMDVTFVAAGLAFPGDGDALDRVAYVLGRHRLDH